MNGGGGGGALLVLGGRGIEDSPAVVATLGLFSSEEERERLTVGGAVGGGVDVEKK